MMVEKKCLCNLFKNTPWSQFAPFFTNCLKGGKHTIAIGANKVICQPQMGLKDSELELFAPIAFNKNGQ
jgi:hypothetical protein